MPKNTSPANDLINYVLSRARVNGLGFDDLALPVQTVVRAACGNFARSEGFMPIHRRFAEATQATRDQLAHPWMSESGTWHQPLFSETVTEGLRQFELLLDVAVNELRPHCASHGWIHGDSSESSEKSGQKPKRRGKKLARKQQSRGRRRARSAIAA